MSIIIVSYNEAEYLPEAIESCLSQNFKDIEIIIGDDGSSDNSLELIKSYCKKYPDTISHFVMERPKDDSNIIPSIRVSNVIKTALGRAKGKYIVLLSGDDYFCDDEKFSDAVAFLDRHDKHSAFISGFKLLFPDGRSYSIYSFYPRNLWWSRVYVHISCFVFRKSVFDEGFFLKRLCDDTGLAYSTACAGRWKQSEKITFVYRQRDNSIYHKSDKIELEISELMLFQDCLNAGRLRLSTYSRFFLPLNDLYQNREKLNNEKYTKYIENCKQYDNNIIEAIINSDLDSCSRDFVLRLIRKAKAARKFFDIIEKTIQFPGRVRRKLGRIYRKLK